MPSYSSGSLIKSARERKRLSQMMLLSVSALGASFAYELTQLSKIENKRHAPRDKTVSKFLSVLDLSVPTFFCPYLTDQTEEVFAVRDRILYLLDDASPLYFDEAESLIYGLERKDGFDSPINRQFILWCKAHVNELRLLDAADTLTLAKEGMALTYKGFDESSFEGNVLIFEEPSLLHTMALAYNRAGEKAKAISLLRRIEEGISHLPEDSREKEKKLAPVMLTLADILIQEGEYNEALAVCLSGNGASIKRNKGAYAPDFLFNMAKCNRSIEQLTLAYFGYCLLHKTELAEQVRTFAKNELDVHIKTYGADGLVFGAVDTKVAHGELMACSDIGTLIAKFREQAGLNQSELCQGICDQTTLAKIEKGTRQGNVYVLEAIVQRLGRDPNKYFCTFPSVEDFADKQVRDEIDSCLLNLNYKEAADLLESLKSSKAYSKRALGRQYLLKTEAALFSNNEGHGNPRYLEMLKEAIGMTRPDFDEREVEGYRLTIAEISIIKQIAVHYCEAGNMKQGLRLFERLKDSINRYYVDEHEKVNSYPSLLYNYSKYLALAERHEDALEIVDEGEALAIKHKQFVLLPSFAVNRACCLLDLGQKEKSVPYFAMAYYGMIILGHSNSRLIIVNHVKEHLGIMFD